MRRAAILAGLASLGLAGLGLAACEGPAVAPAPGADEDGAASRVFRHAIEMDLSGYYLPTQEMTLGRWSLNHLFIGQAADFEAWEAGRRSGTFAPVMLEFVDQESPLVATELGEVRSIRVRVLPETYVVADGVVRLDGRADGIGRVRFEGRLDEDALGVARRNLGDEGEVLRGRLTIADRSFDMAFRWWAGD